MNQSSSASSAVIRMNHPIRWGRPTEMLLLDDPELEQLVLRLHSCSDLAEFWSATRAILDVVAPNDASFLSVNFHDFARSWEASRIFVTPKADKSVGWMHRRRMMDIMPSYILAHPHLPTFRLSEVCPDPRELQSTEFFQGYMKPNGWHHCACLLFWQGARLHTQLTLWRGEAQGDFTAGEMALLSRLHPHLGTALNRLTKATLNATQPKVLKLAGGNLIGDLEAAPGKCMTTNDRGSLLPEAPRMLSEMGHEWHQEESAQTRIAFSDKERTALRLVATGVSNQEISKRLGVSIHTVKWHLANIYMKLGVKNRTAAVKAALGMDLA
jgi:DNA-binding CsgD family transcriptional regulator